MSEVFSDGNMADVVRIGDRVRKQRGTWWTATECVLNHLEHVGYAWSPRVMDADEDWVELSYVPGRTIEADLSGYRDERWLDIIGRRIREYHDAMEGFRLPKGSETVAWPHQPSGDTIICHNDLSPWNTVVNGDSFTGFIDWDLISHGTREWELAWACWRWAPIYPQGKRTPYSAEDQARRCTRLLTAYGFDGLVLDGFVDLIDIRMRAAVDVVEILGAQGVPGFDRLLATGMHLSGHDDRAWLAEHRSTFDHEFARLS
ncbi:MAG: aminoglycoside phosphotransferase family protein [Thermomicrobiales bacterium]|nr:aminoglycoside phosphotransferase family protein [Thermomicrobiales bacterium]